MNKDVFLSILVMDSYQRGLAPGIKGIGGIKIGRATIKNVDLPTGSAAIGFAASAYTLDSTWADLPKGLR